LIKQTGKFLSISEDRRLSVERLGTQAYLDSSEGAESLYKRFGFEAKEDIRVDAREFGGENMIHEIVSFHTILYLNFTNRIQTRP
jgi:hypothetical protein